MEYINKIHVIWFLSPAGNNEKRQNKVSERDWPVSGGEAQNSSEESDSGEKDLLITGHEDGSVKFWSCGGVALTCLATVKTKPYFVGDDLDEPCGRYSKFMKNTNNWILSY